MTSTLLTLVLVVLVAACNSLPANRDSGQANRRSPTIVFPGDELEPASDGLSTRFRGDRVRWTGRRAQHINRGFYFPDEEPELLPERKPESTGDAAEPSEAPSPTPAEKTQPSHSAKHDHSSEQEKPTKSEDTKTSQDAVDQETSPNHHSDAIILPNSNCDTPSHSTTPSSVIHFEDRPTRVRPVLPECDGAAYHAYHNATGKCQLVLTADGCLDGWWFVQDQTSGAAGCRQRRCPSSQVLFKGTCHTLPKRRGVNQPDTNDTATTTDTSRQAQPCPEGMTLYANQFGDGECDCAARNVYWPEHGRCYPVYRRGPCPAGEHLRLPLDRERRRAECVPARCPDGQVYWTRTNDTSYHHQQQQLHADQPAAGSVSGCYPLDSDADSSSGGDDPCPGSWLKVNTTTLLLECRPLVFLAIFDPPPVRCAPGSMLDFRGQCRKKLIQKFRSLLVLTDVRGPGNVCPAGFTETPSGSCVSTSPQGLG